MPTATSPDHGTDRRTARRHRRFAKMWRSMDEAVHEQVLPAKRAVLHGLPSEIVEIGPGCGSNFGLYPRGARVIAFEPNPHFDDDLREAADEHGHALELRRDLLTDRLPAASADVVVSTLVLCSVPDPSAMLGRDLASTATGRSAVVRRACRCAAPQSAPRLPAPGAPALAVAR